MVWRNPQLLDQPDIPPITSARLLPDSVRVASVQYQQRRITSFEEFATQVEYFTDIAADYSADFVDLPRTDHAAAAVDREHRAVAGGIDPQTQPLHAAGEGTVQPSGRPLQHQHHRRHPPHRTAQRRHPQRLLRVPARRLVARTREAAPHAERAQRVEHYAVARAPPPCTPTAARSA